MDFPSEPNIITRVFIKGGRRVSQRRCDDRTEAEVGVMQGHEQLLEAGEGKE